MNDSINLLNPRWPCHCRWLKNIPPGLWMPLQKGTGFSVVVWCISQPCTDGLKLRYIWDDTRHPCLGNWITPEVTVVLGSPLQKCTTKAGKSPVALGLWLSRLSAVRRIDISVFFCLTFPLWTLTTFCPVCLVFLFFLIIRAGTRDARAGAHRGGFRRGER